MKTTSFLGFAIFLLLLCSCSDETPSEATSTSFENVSTNLSVQRKAIDKYISKKQMPTRSDSYTVTPYIDGTDTLMYIVEYRNGWEIFSNSLSMPMSLIKSDTGDFYETISSPNPALKLFFDQLVATLRDDKQSSMPIAVSGSEEWVQYGAIQNLSDINASVSNPNNPPGGNLTYTLVGQKEISYETNNIPHLIKTHWHQDDPFNRFMPFLSNQNSEHILTGCTSVAIAQFLYYAHKKWGLTSYLPSSATYNSTNNKYIFSNYSYDNYSKMIPYYFFEWDGDEGPVFICWIANEINASPAYKNGNYIGTRADFYTGSSFINNLTGYDTQCTDFNDYSAARMIIEGKPVPLWLYNDDGGHVVIIDAVNYSETNIDYYYAYVDSENGNGNTGGDPTMPPGPITSPGSDYESLVAKYGQVYTENRTTFSTSFKFNWGWCSHKHDDIWINGNVINITIKNLQGNDEDVFYKTHKMISYTVK
ncbi:MAG: C10 family peptidase [Muribaculaceae bacterium]|nr:C10 family peptidase [Muribaculaceae bacterium]